MVHFKGREIPDHLWELGLGVRALIERYDAMDRWRRHVLEWVKNVREAAEDPDYPGIAVMYLPQKLEIDEEYALLAAVHDNCISPDRNEELIHPWAAEEDFGGSEEVVTVSSEALDAISTYIFLMKHVLPEQGRQGIERSKADRLLKILRHVANDVRSAARLWTPDRSIYADASDPVEEYATFLQRADTETTSSGTTEPAGPNANASGAADSTEENKGRAREQLRPYVENPAFRQYVKEQVLKWEAWHRSQKVNIRSHEIWRDQYKEKLERGISIGTIDSENPDEIDNIDRLSYEFHSEIASSFAKCSEFRLVAECEPFCFSKAGSVAMVALFWCDINNAAFLVPDYSQLPDFEPDKPFLKYLLEQRENPIQGRYKHIDWFVEAAIVAYEGAPLAAKGYLDITLDDRDREATRLVDSQECVAEFGKKEKPWDLLEVLIKAGGEGIHRREIENQIGGSLDKHKATLLTLVEPLKLDIVLSRGIWTLKSM